MPILTRFKHLSLWSRINILVVCGLLTYFGLSDELNRGATTQSAKIIRIYNDFNGITTAIYTYLDRYGTLPGDDDKAGSRWGLEIGNADGILDGKWSADKSCTTNCETYHMWSHLKAANLVANPEPPKNAFGGAIGVQDVNNTDNPIEPGVTNLDINGIVICMDNLMGEAAKIVDVYFDDGNARTGLLKAIEGMPNNPALATSVYNVTMNYMLCKRI